MTMIRVKATPKSVKPLQLKRFFSTQFKPLGRQDVVIVGGGVGGYVAAIKASQLGLKTTCVESRGALGGTCLNVGCIPSKSLLNSSHKYEELKHLHQVHGINIHGFSLDLPQMMKQKDARVKGLTSGVESLFLKYKVNYVRGKGKITNPNQVLVELNNGEGTQLIDTNNIIIATGSEVASLPTIKIDEKKIVSSTGALSLSEVPKKMVVIGGGIIGLELGSVWSRLGSEVTVVEYTGRIAAGADPEVATDLQKILTKQGLKFQMNTKVLSAVYNSNGTVTVATEDAKGGNQQTLDADVVLVSVGRKPFTDALGLKEVGVQSNDKGFVLVNSTFTTNIPSIRAIGDVIGGPMLAHKAEEEGVIVAEDLINPGTAHINYNTVPSVVYTWPEVAWVGYNEEELKNQNIQYKVGKFPFKANSRARTNADTDGFVKFLADAKTDKLLGAHIIGANAGELIHEAVVAIEYGASSEDIGRTSHAHPTLSEAVKEAAMSIYAKTINF